MKKALKIILVVFLLGFAVLALPWILLAFLIMTSPNPPIPEQKYGEFEFRLVYIHDDEQIAIEDTLICEYDGIGMNEGRGKYIKWKQWYKSGNDAIVLLDLGIGSGIGRFGDVIKSHRIIYPLAPAEHFMGFRADYVELFPDAAHFYIYDHGWGSDRIAAEKLLEEYGISLISWEVAPPISNIAR